MTLLGNNLPLDESTLLIYREPSHSPNTMIHGQEAQSHGSSDRGSNWLRPRVPCDNAEIPRALEGNRKAARRNEAAVLKEAFSDQS